MSLSAEKKSETAILPTAVRTPAENVFSAQPVQNLQVAHFSAPTHEKNVAEKSDLERRLQEMEILVKRLQIGPPQPVLAVAPPQVVEGGAHTAQIAAVGTGGKADLTPCQQSFLHTTTRLTFAQVNRVPPQWNGQKK